MVPEATDDSMSDVETSLDTKLSNQLTAVRETWARLNRAFSNIIQPTWTPDNQSTSITVPLHDTQNSPAHSASLPETRRPDPRAATVEEVPDEEPEFAAARSAATASHDIAFGPMEAQEPAPRSSSARRDLEKEIERIRAEQAKAAHIFAAPSPTDHVFSGYEPAPSIMGAQKAWEDIKLLLRPPRKSGRGYKPFTGDDELYDRMVQMRQLLHRYHTGVGGWIELSIQVAEDWERGAARAKLLRAWTRAFIADRHALPYSAYVNGNWNQCLLDQRPELREALNAHLSSIGKHVCAIDIVDFMSKPETLKEFDLEKGIKISTAHHWMRRLAYRWTKVPTGQFVDGHEREDVVAYRRDVFLPAMAQYDFEIRQWTSNGEEVSPPHPPEHPELRTVIWYHDESTFYAHDRRLVRWVHETEDPVPRAKGEGVSLMVADFVSADYGWLRSPDGTESAQVLFKAGKQRDGWFTHEEIIEQISKAMAILRKHYPNERHIFVFDNATTHRKRAADALSARRMSLHPTRPNNPMFGVEVNEIDEATGRPTYSPDGSIIKKKIRMADARFADGTPQSLYFPEGHTRAGTFKGMANILTERGINITGLKAQCLDFKCAPPALECCCRRILYNQPDFRDVESLLETHCREQGFKVIFLPKFHCELNPIEQCWGYAKEVYRKFPPSSSEADLEVNVVKALNAVPLLSIRR